MLFLCLPSCVDWMLPCSQCVWLRFDATSNVWPSLSNNLDKHGPSHSRSITSIWILIGIILWCGLTCHFCTRHESTASMANEKKNVEIIMPPFGKEKGKHKSDRAKMQVESVSKTRSAESIRMGLNSKHLFPIFVVDCDKMLKEVEGSI